MPQYDQNVKRTLLRFFAFGKLYKGDTNLTILEEKMQPLSWLYIMFIIRLPAVYIHPNSPKYYKAKILYNTELNEES